MARITTKPRDLSELCFTKPDPCTPLCPGPPHVLHPSTDAQGFLFSFLGTETQAPAVSCAPPAPPHALHGPAPGQETSWGLLWAAGPKPVRSPWGSRRTDGPWHPSGVPTGSGVAQGWDVLADAVRGVVVSAPSPAQESGAGPYREGRAVPGGRRERSRAERSGGGSPGSATGTGSGTGDRDVPQDGSAGESAGIGAVRSAPRAAREPRSRSRAARWVRPAPGRSHSERRTLGERDGAMAGSPTGPGAAPAGHSVAPTRGVPAGGFAGAVKDRRHGAARAGGCGQPCSGNDEHPHPAWSS